MSKFTARLPRSYLSPLYHFCWLGPVALVFVLATGRPAIVTRLQDQVFDLYQRIAPRAFDPAAPVRIVDIDDRSIAAIGQWPWPRTRIADLIDRLTRAKATVIAFDMVFAEPDRTSPDAFLAGIDDVARRSAVAQALAGVKGNDERLGAALNGAPVVLGFILAQKRGAIDVPPTLSPPWGMAFAGDDPKAFAPAFSALVAPLATLQDNAAGLGALNWLPDGDQIVRRVPLLLRASEGSSDRLVPSLALESLRVAQGASTFLVRASNASGEWHSGVYRGIQSVRVGALTAPTGARGDVRPHYTLHRPERFISAASILDGSFDPTGVAARFVIVGSSAAGLTDIRATPVDPAMPGVEVQAQALETVLAQSQLTRLPWTAGELVVGVLLAAVLAAMLPLVPAMASAAFVASALGAIVAASWTAFTHHLLIDALVPCTMMVAAYVGSTAALFRTEQRARRFVQGAFGRFVSPAVVSRLAADPSALTLGGDLRPLTVMFTDVRNFSAIAESMEPRALTRFMNRYLSPMTAIVLKRGGTVDKYIGDAIMAFWNAPLPDPDHAGNAVRAALDMLDALPALRGDMMAESGGTFPPIRCGIGLASGPCVVGNFGSALRFDYSALGDDVNLASRLESLSKVYGLDILASEATATAAPAFAWLEVDTVVVAGRAGATRIFTPLGGEDYARSATFVDVRDTYAAALGAYRTRRFDTVLAAIGDPLWCPPPSLIKLYDTLRARCEAFLKTPPPLDWQGVTLLDRK